MTNKPREGSGVPEGPQEISLDVQNSVRRVAGLVAAFAAWIASTIGCLTEWTKRVEADASNTAYFKQMIVRDNRILEKYQLTAAGEEIPDSTYVNFFGANDSDLLAAVCMVHRARKISLYSDQINALHQDRAALHSKKVILCKLAQILSSLKHCPRPMVEKLFKLAMAKQLTANEQEIFSILADNAESILDTLSPLVHRIAALGKNANPLSLLKTDSLTLNNIGQLLDTVEGLPSSENLEHIIEVLNSHNRGEIAFLSETEIYSFIVSLNTLFSGLSSDNSKRIKLKRFLIKYIGANKDMLAEIVVDDINSLVIEFILKADFRAHDEKSLYFDSFDFLVGFANEATLARRLGLLNQCQGVNYISLARLIYEELAMSSYAEFVQALQKLESEIDSLGDNYSILEGYLEFDFISQLCDGSLDKTVRILKYLNNNIEIRTIMKEYGSIITIVPADQEDSGDTITTTALQDETITIVPADQEDSGDTEDSITIIVLEGKISDIADTEESIEDFFNNLINEVREHDQVAQLGVIDKSGRTA